MAEYIEREAAKEAVVKAVGKGYSPFNAIVMLPAADVRPVVRGKWLESDCGPLQKCSICKATGWDGFYFCPNCGADMRAEEG